jgi:hypothetical protein
MSFSGVYGPPGGAANAGLSEQEQQYVKMVRTCVELFVAVIFDEKLT